MRDVVWWCVARGESWRWEWEPYPGVWLFVVTFAVLYWTMARPHRGRGSQSAAAAGGLVLLWLSLDWPAGALGAGYLASVHSLQFLFLAMIVPPLLLYGVSAEGVARIAGNATAMALLRRVTAPLFAAPFFTVVMAGTHASPALDGFMQTQLGSFSLDMLWLSAGALLAWPLIVKAPRRENFGPPLQILYLFGGTVVHVFVGMWLLSSGFPVYATYEQAPRIANISALTDQHLAGAVILLLGSPIVLGAVTYIFFKWQGTGKERGSGGSNYGLPPSDV
jgi:cytochrome c oxidase assembly factor CtaG